MSNELLSLISLFGIVVLPYAIWHFGRMRSILPCAVVQILLGVALGPSFLGALAPELQAALLPPAIQNQIAGVASLAILFFAFVTGLHIDLSHYRDRGAGFALVGAGSVLVPLGLGALAAWWIQLSYPAEVPATGEARWFVMSVAVALSVTALPVLGAILRELGLIRQTLGQWSLGLAALNDAALWFLLSVLLAGAGHAGESDLPPALTAVCGAAYVAAMYGVVRPALERLAHGTAERDFGDAALVAVTALAVLSAVATQLLGLHYLLGAFVAGTVLPTGVRAAVLDRIETAMVFLLTPFFFIATGLKVSIDLSSESLVPIFVLTTAAAILGKMIGTALPARLVGLGWRQSLALGSLMQAKGMMELAVLSILSDAGLITGQMFSALTLMAVVTTALAMPLARLFGYGRNERRRTEAAPSVPRFAAPVASPSAPKARPR